jgi:CRP-like cAMP-binding protein
LWPGIALKHRTVVTEHDPSVAQQLFALTGRELHRIQDRILLLIKNARERVASFLLEMVGRAAQNNTIDL